MDSSHHDLPSPVAPLRRLLEATLTVADIVSTPMWGVPVGVPVVDALAAMESRRFDFAGLGDEGPERFVRRSELAAAVDRGDGGRRVESLGELIPASLCVEKSLPISRLLELFEEEICVFVLDGDDVRWIVTVADLAAPAVSVAVLSFLTVIEAGLKQLAVHLSDEEILSRLPGARQRRVREVFANLARANAETTLRDALFLGDWLRVSQSDQGILNGLGYSSGNAFKKGTSGFETLRNDLAHGRSLLVGTKLDVRSMLGRVRRIRAFAELVWEQVECRRPIWDVYVKSEITLTGRWPKRLSGAGALDAWPYAGRVFVLTAWNPGSTRASLRANLAANRDLRAALLRAGSSPVRVLGASPDGTWQEESYLVAGLDEIVATQLAALFGQAAYFELDASRQIVRSARTGAILREANRVLV